MNPMLSFAVKAARRAGQVVLRYMHSLEQMAVDSKGRHDLVSEVDRMVEAEIVDFIQDRYPDHGIVAEERGGQLGTGPNHKGVEWIIDPLDGTINYVHSHPQFAIAIAMREDSVLQHAVVFDPMRDELYTASRGQGAQLNNRRIRVTRQHLLEQSLLACGFVWREADAFNLWVKNFKALSRRAMAIRCGGSAALDLAYVASGRLDGYWQDGLGAWDVAAGSLLVREAGGLATDFEGQQNFLENGQIVAANSKIFNQLLQIVTTSTTLESALFDKRKA